MFATNSKVVFLVINQYVCYCCYSAPVGSGVLQSVCLSVCLSASISLEPLCRSSRNFMCRSPVSVARPHDDVAIRYVLRVLWMMLRLAVVGHIAGVAIPGWSLMSVNALLTTAVN